VSRSKCFALTRRTFPFASTIGREGDPLRRRFDSIIKSNLQGGRVELEIETKDGMAYTITRTLDGESIVFDSDKKPVSLKGSRLIPADVYSQNQIENIAETTHYQLDLIDKFADSELSRIALDLELLETDVQANSQQIISLLKQQIGLAEHVKERPLVDEQLKAYSKTGGADAAAINNAHALKALRDRETHATDSVAAVISALGKQIKKASGGLSSELPTLFASDLLEGPNGPLLSQGLKKTGQVGLFDL
jgi:hypothetical protein